ncbi:MAG: hypothetical protein K6F33_11180 [Bacteroidales bacterium]|nr:hypothetical protein [Bacteroidales bacterium]
MNTMELRGELLQSIDSLQDNENLMRELLSIIKNFISKHKKIQVETPLHDSDEDIEAGLRQAFKELKAIKEGKMETRDFFEVVNEL